MIDRSRSLDFVRLAGAVDQIALDSEGRITGAQEATRDFVGVMEQIFSGKYQPKDWQEVAGRHVFVSREQTLELTGGLAIVPTGRVLRPGSIVAFKPEEYKSTIAVRQYKPSAFANSIELTATANVGEDGILSGLKHYLSLEVAGGLRQLAVDVGFVNNGTDFMSMERDSNNGLTAHPDVADAWHAMHEELASIHRATLDLSKTNERDHRNRTSFPTNQHVVMRRHPLNTGNILNRATALRQARLTALVRR